MLALAPVSITTTVPSTTEELVSTYLPLIRLISRRILKRLPPTVELDELVNIGVLGLMDAWDRYDGSRGVPFKSYAELRIRGQIIDSLRDDDIVPRSVRRKHTRLEQERDVLQGRLGRAPTHEEVRNQLDLTPQAYATFVADATVATVTSLDTPANDEGSQTLLDLLASNQSDAEDCFGEKEVSQHVARAIAQLPERERAAVVGYYLHRETLRDIGQRLGVTESRACQLRSQGVKRLQNRLRHVAR